MLIPRMNINLHYKAGSLERKWMKTWMTDSQKPKLNVSDYSLRTSKYQGNALPAGWPAPWPQPSRPRSESLSACREPFRVTPSRSRPCRLRFRVRAGSSLPFRVARSRRSRRSRARPLQQRPARGLGAGLCPSPSQPGGPRRCARAVPGVADRVTATRTATRTARVRRAGRLSGQRRRPAKGEHGGGAGAAGGAEGGIAGTSSRAGPGLGRK